MKLEGTCIILAFAVLVFAILSYVDYAVFSGMTVDMFQSIAIAGMGIICILYVVCAVNEPKKDELAPIKLGK